MCTIFHILVVFTSWRSTLRLLEESAAYLVEAYLGTVRAQQQVKEQHSCPLSTTPEPEQDQATVQPDLISSAIEVRSLAEQVRVLETKVSYGFQLRAHGLECSAEQLNQVGEGLEQVADVGSFARFSLTDCSSRQRSSCHSR